MSVKGITLLISATVGLAGCVTSQQSGTGSGGTSFNVAAGVVVPAGVPCSRIDDRYRSSVAGCETSVRSSSGGMTREQLIDLNVKFQREVVHFVNFDFDKDALRPDSRRILDQQAAWIRQYPDLHFSVFGHTDLVGSQDYNFDLAKRRADAVVNYLIARGVSIEQLESVVSFGKTQPLIQTTRPEERNRRAVTEVSGYLRLNAISLVPIPCGYLQSGYLPTYSQCIGSVNKNAAIASSIPATNRPPGGPAGPGDGTPGSGPSRDVSITYGYEGDRGGADPDGRGGASITTDSSGNEVREAFGQTGPVEAPRTDVRAYSNDNGTVRASAGGISVERDRYGNVTFGGF